MRKTAVLFLVLFLVSCTSNTIFKKPKDLIPKDTMTLLIQDMLIATSGKFIKNKNLQKNINYVPFIYDKYKIDSLRFQNSNLYYMSELDFYKEIFNDVKSGLESQKKYYEEIKSTNDSIKKDSINKAKSLKKRVDDSIKKVVKENLKNLKLKAEPKTRQ